MKLKYYVAIASVMALIIGVWCVKKLEDNQVPEEDYLVVGIAADYAPYVSINHNGEYEGFDIDVARALADRMGKKLVLQDLGSMAPLFMALDQGTVDLLLWGISITQERVKKVDFIPYHGQMIVTYPLIFWGAIPIEVSTLADMKGMRICAEPASAQSAVLDRYQNIFTIVPTERVDDAFLAIQQGKADAALVDPAIAKKFKASFPEIQILEVPLAPEDQSYGMGIPVKKTNTQLKTNIQCAIDELKVGGVIKQLEEKWAVA